MRSNGHTCKIIHMVTIPYISFYTVLPHTAFQFLRNESSWLCRECARAHWDWEMRMIIFDDCYGGSLMFSFVWVIASPLSTASVQWDCLSASRCCCCYCHCSRCCCTELYSTHSYSKKKQTTLLLLSMAKPSQEMKYWVGFLFFYFKTLVICNFLCASHEHLSLFPLRKWSK